MKCGISGEEVRLFDAICDGRMSSICERCSIIENIPIIKKPDISQLREAEQKFGVYQRMRRLSGIEEPKEQETFFIEDKLEELDKKPELELPEKDKLNLVEHFHWEIMKNRRRKGLSQEKLAEALGESETAIQMIEKEKLPENAEILIKKLEQFFQIKLRQISEMERIMEAKRKRQRTVLLDRQGRELEVIPEPKIEKVEEVPDAESLIEEAEIEPKIVGAEEAEEKQEAEKIEEKEAERDLRGMDVEKGELDIHEANLSSLTIADLKELHRRKIEATKQEKEEEKEKIEERQKLIEARKEELRLIREKESRELNDVLGGSELLEKEEDSEKRWEDFDEELI